MRRLEIRGKEIRRLDRLWYGGHLAGIAEADASPLRCNREGYLKILLSGGYCDVFWITPETTIEVERT